MKLAGVCRAFGMSLTALGASMTPPFLWARLSSGPGAEPDAYLFAMILTIFFGVGLVALSPARRVSADFRDALLTILLWWIVSPAFAAVPFVLMGQNPFDAYFETVSALTTTGAWLSEESVRASEAGMLWRACLQWLGGLASLAVAAAIFIRPAFIGIDTLLPPFSRGDEASYLRAIRSALATFTGAYAALTFLCFTLSSVAGAPGLDAIVLSLSAVSTGGFIPNAEGFGAYPFAVVGALLPFVVLGGANFILIARLFERSARRSADIETSVFVGAIFAVGVAFWLATGAGDLDRLPAQIFNAASLFSTNGVLIGDAPTLPFALVTVIIGGSAISTAGGFKILRWLVIIARAREEIRRLVMPSAVFRHSSIANELGVWMHFLVFTMTLAALTLIMTATGHGFTLSITGAASILSNAGPVLALAEGGAEGYAVFDRPVRLVLCFGMILGRLEAVVALAVLNAAFWRS